MNDACLTNGLNYSVFRCDRSDGGQQERGGGVCILTRNETIHQARISLPSVHCHNELCVIDILFKAGTPIRLFSLYKPPGANRNADNVKCTTDLINCIEMMFDGTRTNIICGDLNLPEIIWTLNNYLKCNDFTATGVLLSFYYK